MIYVLPIKNKKKLSLNLEDRKTQKELRKDWLLSIENERRLRVGLEEFISYKEMEDFNESDTSIENNKLDTKNTFEAV